MLLSCAFYVRNIFGLIVLPAEGLFLLLCGWKLPAAWLDHLYNFLAATCCLNAFENIRDLYGMSQGGYAGGEMMDTDAHTVAEYWGGDYRLWATLWLILAVVMTIIGIVGARDARALPWSTNRGAQQQSSVPATAYTASATTHPQYVAHVV
jgi:hypothetical protein